MADALDTGVPAQREAFEANPKPFGIPATGVRDALASMYSEAYHSGATALSAARGAAAALSNAADAAAAYADDRSGTLITDIDETTQSRVQGIIASGIQDGQSDNEVADRLGSLFGESRANLIASTEMATAWNTGIGSALKDAGEDYVWVTDGDGCDICADIGEEGQAWDIDEFLANPIEHPHCFPSDVLVSAPDRQFGTERRYDGELVVLHTATHQLLPVTPNHPILTTKGWLPAKTIRQGDHVLRSSGPGLWEATSGANKYEAPSPIEQVARAARMPSEKARVRLAPTRPDDFHGDGKGSEVYIERPLGFLRRGLEPEAKKRQPHLSFRRRCVNAGTFGRKRQLLSLCRRCYAAASGGIGRLHPGSSLEQRLRRPDGLHRIAVRTYLDPESPESLTNATPGHVENRADFIRRALLLQVHGTQGGVRRPTSKQVAGAMDRSGDRLAIQAEALPNLLNALSGLITAEEVVSVGSRWYRGHVYNLQTSSNWYVAGDYISHNCFRDARPLTAEELAEILADEGDVGGEPSGGGDFGVKFRHRRMKRVIEERLGVLEEQFIRVVGPYARRGLFYSEGQARDAKDEWTSGGGAYAEPPFGAAVDKMFREDRSRGIKTRSVLLYKGKFDDHLEHVRASMKAAGYKETNGMPLDLPGVKEGAELQYEKNGRELNVYMRSNGNVTALTADETPMDTGGRLHTTDNFIPGHLRDALHAKFGVDVEQEFYAEDEARDDHGRWTSGGGGEHAWDGKAVELTTHPSKQETGSMGEHAVLTYLRDTGFPDARMLNTEQSNYPVDMAADHGAFEIKTGLVSNGTSAQQWRATIGEPGLKEKALEAKMSPARLERWNERKMQDILDRKEAARAQLSKELGRPVKGFTMGVILNPDKGTADIYRFDGFSLRIGWNSPEARAGYLTTVRIR